MRGSASLKTERHVIKHQGRAPEIGVRCQAYLKSVHLRQNPEARRDRVNHLLQQHCGALCIYNQRIVEVDLRTAGGVVTQHDNPHDPVPFFKG